MRATLSLVRREFAAYFLGPVGYVALVLVLLATGMLFRFTLDLLTASGPRGVEFPMQRLLGDVGFWLIFWVIPPLLTMRMFAEERSTGTLEMLMTAPLRDGQVVLGKFIAAKLFFIVLWLPTLIYLPILLDLTFEWPGWIPGRVLVVSGVGAFAAGAVLGVFTSGRIGRMLAWLLVLGGLASGIAGAVMLAFVEKEPLLRLSAGIDPMPVLTAYIALLLAGKMFLALGLWVSSLVRSQIVAALVALALNLVFILGGLVILGGFYPTPSDTAEPWFRALTFVSVPLHFSQDFSRGIVDTRFVVLYVSVTLAALFLTVRSLESRRWQ